MRQWLKKWSWLEKRPKREDHKANEPCLEKLLGFGQVSQEFQCPRRKPAAWCKHTTTRLCLPPLPLALLRLILVQTETTVSCFVCYMAMSTFYMSPFP